MAKRRKARRIRSRRASSTIPTVSRRSYRRVRHAFGRARRGYSRGSDIMTDVFTDLGVGSTVSIVADAVKPTGLPVWLTPLVSFGVRFLSGKGNMKHKLIHAAVSAGDTYVTDRILRNQPIIPSLNLTSGQGSGLASGFTVVS